MLAVVDAYHAMRSGRPYRDPVDEREAIEELRNAAGQFDPRVVEALVEVLGRRTEGVSGPEARFRDNGQTEHEGTE